MAVALAHDAVAAAVALEHDAAAAERARGVAVAVAAAVADVEQPADNIEYELVAVVVEDVVDVDACSFVVAVAAAGRFADYSETLPSTSAEGDTADDEPAAAAAAEPCGVAAARVAVKAEGKRRSAVAGRRIAASVPR